MTVLKWEPTIHAAEIGVAVKDGVTAVMLLSVLTISVLAQGSVAWTDYGEIFDGVAYYAINENPSPVFSTLIGDQAYVIKDNINYKMYYVCGTDWGICLAQSPDGITWTPYGTELITGEGYHADVKYYSTGFPGANDWTNPSALTMYYRIWYQKKANAAYGIDGWGYAESPDGIDWYNRRPVAQFGTPVYSAALGPNYGIADVIYTPGASNTGTDWTFRIYANVQWQALDEFKLYSGKELVVMAFSSDGYNWTGYDPTSVGHATPIFAGTLDQSQFDCDHIGWFKVIKNTPTDWEAFYSGGKGTTYRALNGIGYATSTDGINWTRKQALFTSSDGVAWRSQSVWMPSVVKTGSNYQIWFLGSNNPDIDNSDFIQWKVGRAILTPVTFSVTGSTGSTWLSATAVAEGTLPTAGKPSVQFPVGLFSFTINTDTGFPAGQTVTVTITLASALPAGDFSYWKVHGGSWVRLPSGQASLSSDRKTITLILTDGASPDDDDGAANRVIVDPGGPAIAVAPTGAPVGGFMQPVNKLAVFAPYLFLGLAVLAVIVAAPWKKPKN
jgi:hypothetical protein